MTKYIFGWSSIQFAGLWPSFLNISVMRKINGILLSTKQLKIISATVKSQSPCKLLIFGLGNDSLFWFRLNRGGVTVFIEDNDAWFQDISKRLKNIPSFLVDYNTQRNDWKRLLGSPALLDMPLPADVENESWDVILVDAPVGFEDHDPGRMKSIFLASRLARNSCDVFVDDCDREVEDIYCNSYLHNRNLKAEIKGPNGLLRHYRINCPMVDRVDVRRG